MSVLKKFFRLVSFRIHKLLFAKRYYAFGNNRIIEMTGVPVCPLLTGPYTPSVSEHHWD
jgi:hypothetical protein